MLNNSSRIMGIIRIILLLRNRDLVCLRLYHHLRSSSSSSNRRMEDLQRRRRRICNRSNNTSINSSLRVDMEDINKVIRMGDNGLVQLYVHFGICGIL
jgi:hypothetical protein